MKIPIIVQLAVLTVLLTGFYMMVGQSVPQKEVHPPEVVEIAADVSTEEMVDIGRGIFEGKGICATCHTIGKSGALRFPDLDGIATRAATRKPGMSALDYMAESLYEPNVFIVEGFNPGMPEANKPPIGLTDPEILSVIAYLQTLGGDADVTMETRLVYTGGSLSGESNGDGAEAAEAAGTDGAEAASGPLASFGCTRCHDGEQPSDPPAPSLVGIGSRMDADALLLELYKHEGDDGLDQVTVAEMTTLVDALAAQ